MRQSILFSSTLRDVPADAEAVSHRLLLRAGFIRQLAAGIYTFLPLGRRVLRNIESIVREEMDRAGAQELLMPALQPSELWKESGRYTVYGPELIRLKDRNDREFALGPTHEEVITTLVKHEIGSYRRFPFILYQIQTKFRDERRPRFGLLRGREFLMKDAYSFDTTWEGLDRSYHRMYEAYCNIFDRCGLTFRAVEADAGAIGGQGGSHEFMALTDIGEDTVAVCSHCDYAANLEKACAGTTSRPGAQERQPSHPLIEKLYTPGARTIDQLVRLLQTEPKHIIRTLIYAVDGQPLAVLVRGDHEVNETKLRQYLGTDNIEPAQHHALEETIPIGYAGPVGLKLPVLADAAVARMPSAIVGANEVDAHLNYVVPGRDFSLERTGDFRNVLEGDPCPRCDQGKLRLIRGIEVGHVFKLGTKYSEQLGARYVDENGKEQTSIMGCYGIGVSRLLSAIAEQHHDERGLMWPPDIAPFHVHIIPVSIHHETQMNLAEELYDRLRRHGIDVLLDDRDERAGVKFNDADLMGIPIRLVVGKHADAGNVEMAERQAVDKLVLTKEEAIDRILGLLEPTGD